MISVIVAIFNVEEYLEQCIKSILNQSYVDLEVILVDDGSNDNSGSICDKYQMYDDRVVVVHQRNQGLVKARKTGLSVSSGEYIAFVDGDDCLEHDMYEVLMNQMQFYNVDFVHSGYKNGIFERNDSGKHEHIIFGSLRDRIDFIRDHLFLNSTDRTSLDITPSIWSKLFRRELIVKSYGKVPDYISYGEDVFALCVCLLNCISFVNIDRAYYHYRIRTNSMANNIKRPKLGEQFMLSAAMAEYFRQNGIDGLFDCVLTYFEMKVLEHIRIFCGSHIDEYIFPNIEKLYNKRVVLYGAGNVGQSYYSYFRKYVRIDLVKWIAADSRYDNSEYLTLESPDSIADTSFDYVVVAVESATVAEDIRSRLEGIGVLEDAILWEKPQRLTDFIH